METRVGGAFTFLIFHSGQWMNASPGEIQNSGSMPVQEIQDSGSMPVQEIQDSGCMPVFGLS